MLSIPLAVLACGLNYKVESHRIKRRSFFVFFFNIVFQVEWKMDNLFSPLSRWSIQGTLTWVVMWRSCGPRELIKIPMISIWVGWYLPRHILLFLKVKICIIKSVIGFKMADRDNLDSINLWNIIIIELIRLASSTPQGLIDFSCTKCMFVSNFN